MSELEAARAIDPRRERPFPPGSYPLVVVGSGPGGLQVSYSLRRLGVPHAVLSADPEPGGMFRRFPFFQRLLSWTKPYAAAPRGSRAYERYDWNSLLGEDDASRALMPEIMDFSSYFPSREEMESNLRRFAERGGIEVRYGCRWLATRREEAADGQRFVLETSDGEYSAGAVIFAVGIAEPYVPATPGLDLIPHYVDTKPAEAYADKRVFIVGKQNSGFELASGLLPWARSIALASPSPAKLSVVTRSLVGVRARYLQPYEDHVLAGGVSVLEAKIGGIERDGETWRVTLYPTSGGDAIVLEADEAIAATGFVAPLLDLPGLGVATFGQSRLPACTPYWESATVPGVYFAGTLSQGAAGLKKHGLPANSGAVHGARYNARTLAGHVAARRFGIPPKRPLLSEDEAADLLAAEIATAPELWHQRAYLARVVSLDPAEGIRDEGIRPLAAFVDEPGPDAVAATIEADETGAVFPVLYTRRRGAIAEHALPGHPTLDFAGSEHRRALASVLADVGVRAAPGSGDVAVTGLP